MRSRNYKSPGFPYTSKHVFILNFTDIFFVKLFEEDKTQFLTTFRIPQILATQKFDVAATDVQSHFRSRALMWRLP